MLDSYVSSTTQPSSDVINLRLWAMVTNKPNQEPIDNLLKCHHHHLQNTAFKPTHHTYSILLSALCKQDLSNAKEPVIRLPRSGNHQSASTVTLENLIQSSANINLFDPDIFKVNPIARLELTTKAFKILEDHQELTAELYSNLIILLGFSNKLPQAKALFESYKQSPFNPDSQNSTQVHQQALKPPSPLTRVSPDSLTVQNCQSEPSSINQILEVILGLIRSEDYSSASTWIKRLFNGDHAPYRDGLSPAKSSLPGGTVDGFPPSNPSQPFQSVLLHQLGRRNRFDHDQQGRSRYPRYCHVSHLGSCLMVDGDNTLESSDPYEKNYWSWFLPVSTPTLAVVANIWSKPPPQLVGIEPLPTPRSTRPRFLPVLTPD
ncbi:hypothetical protein PCASD_09531 [Puccinia coronata f. sp. avenae]|uniref:Uncharacterized protein n=1 Tax=Puccinia coronata f. sp. avenae TaxID=200324 RepID=A0A2N5U6B2_9BASI|nr:hypothetical protein PCASD_09531 [Puccinia coronata f. sp. avenae]